MLHAHLHEREIRRLLGQPEAGQRVLEAIAPLHEPADHCLYFVNRDVDEPLREELRSRRGCVVIAKHGEAARDDWGEAVVIETRDPRAAIAAILVFLESEGRLVPRVRTRRIDPSASISPLAVIEGDVEIGERAVVEPFCVIGPDVRIGSGTIIRSGARIYPRVTIGSDCQIGANAVIGYGFGFVRDDEGNKAPLPQLGGLIIGDRVYVGSSSIVQSGTLQPTVLEDYVKISDLVMVGHNVRVGRNTTIIPGGMIGGSAIVEADVWMGLNATVRDGATVGRGSLVGMDGSVQDDVPGASAVRAARSEVRSRDGDANVDGFPKK